MRRCKYCGKSNVKRSTYCIICGKKLNSSPDFKGDERKAFFEGIINNYIKRYNLTPSQKIYLDEKLSHTSLSEKNFYRKISNIIKEVIVTSLNDKTFHDGKFQKSDKNNYSDILLQLNEDFNFKLKKLKKLICEDFTDSKITKDYFMSHIDYCEKLFWDKSEIIDRIIRFEGEGMEMVVEENIDVLKLITEKITRLTEEIIIFLSSTDKTEIDNLITDMDNLITSVKNYDQ